MNPAPGFESNKPIPEMKRGNTLIIEKPDVINFGSSSKFVMGGPSVGGYEVVVPREHNIGDAEKCLKIR